MSVLRYCCFRWLVYDRALVFEPSRPLACIMLLLWLIYVLELCCDIFPWVPDLDRTHLRAWLVYGQIGGVTSWYQSRTAMLVKVLQWLDSTSAKECGSGIPSCFYVSQNSSGYYSIFWKFLRSLLLLNSLPSGTMVNSIFLAISIDILCHYHFIPLDSLFCECSQSSIRS